MGKLTKNVQKSVQDQVRQSILDLRTIYHEMTDEKFAAWYNKKYKVPVVAILHGLEVHNAKTQQENQTVQD